MSKIYGNFFSNRVNGSFSSCTWRNYFFLGKQPLPFLHPADCSPEDTGKWEHWFSISEGKQSYGLLKLGTTPELTINSVSLSNLLLFHSSSSENSTLDSIQKEFFWIFLLFDQENCWNNRKSCLNELCK